MLFVARCALFVVCCCPLSVNAFSLFAVCCLLLFVLLIGVRCLLLAVRCCFVVWYAVLAVVRCRWLSLVVVCC